MAQARVPGAGIVDRDPYPERAERRQPPRELIVVVDRLVLGDLDDHPLGDRLQDGRQVRGAGGAVRAVDREIGARWELGEAERRLPDRRELELDPEVERASFGEPFVGPAHRERPEPREGLDPDHIVVLEVDDRLERHGHPLARDEPQDLAAARLELLLFDLLATELG